MLLLCALCDFAVNGLFLKAFSPLRREVRQGRFLSEPEALATVCQLSFYICLCFLRLRFRLVGHARQRNKLLLLCALCDFAVKVLCFLKSILTAKTPRTLRKIRRFGECCFFFADLPLVVILLESGESRNIQADKRLDLRIREDDKSAGLRR